MGNSFITARGERFFYIAIFPMGNSTMEKHSHSSGDAGGGGGVDEQL